MRAGEKNLLLKIYSTVMCLTLLASAVYAVLHTERDIIFEIRDRPIRPTSVCIKPNQTLIVKYTITYGEITRIHYTHNGTHINLSFNPPVSRLDFQEQDFAGLDIDAVIDRNVYLQMKVYTPSGRLEYELGYSSVGFTVGWQIEELGTYQIHITNLDSIELMIECRFRFLRLSKHKPFIYPGFVMLSIGVLYPIMLIVLKILRKPKLS